MGETRRKLDLDFREGRSSSLPSPARTSLCPPTFRRLRERERRATTPARSGFLWAYDFA